MSLDLHQSGERALRKCLEKENVGTSARLPIGARATSGSMSASLCPECLAKLLPKPTSRKKKCRSLVSFFVLLKRKYCPHLIKLPPLQLPHCSLNCLQACSSCSSTTKSYFSSWCEITWFNWKGFRLELLKMDLIEFRLELSEPQLPYKVINAHNFFILDFVFWPIYDQLFLCCIQTPSLGYDPLITINYLLFDSVAFLVFSFWCFWKQNF